MHQPIINNIKFRMASSSSNVFAWASFVVDDWLYLNNIAIMFSQHTGNPYLRYPMLFTERGKYSHYKPLTKESGQHITTEVLQELDKVLDL